MVETFRDRDGNGIRDGNDTDVGNVHIPWNLLGGQVKKNNENYHTQQHNTRQQQHNNNVLLSRFRSSLFHGCSEEAERENGNQKGGQVQKENFDTNC